MGRNAVETSVKTEVTRISLMASDSCIFAQLHVVLEIMELTKKEQNAINALKRLEKRWPETLWIYAT